MRIIRSALGLEPEGFSIDERLTEAHYGSWQGTLASDLAAIDPEGMAARARDPFRWRPLGGESYADLMARTLPWLAGDRARHGHRLARGVSRVLRGHILGLDLASVPGLDVPQDRVLVLRHDGIDWL